MKSTLLLALFLTGCTGDVEEIPAEDPAAAVEQERVKEQAPAAAATTAKAEPSPEVKALLTKLDPDLATKTAPDKFTVVFNTSEGEVAVEVNREDAPNGADRLYNLVQMGFYEEVAFFRVIDGFMAQAGMHGTPEVNDLWRDASIKDDPVTLTNERGTLTFATRGPNTRTTQLFFNFKDNGNLDGMGFSPVGRVTSGMDVIDSLYSGYGEGQPRGRGPAQQLITLQGNAYLQEKFPELDYIKNARIR